MLTDTHCHLADPLLAGDAVYPNSLQLAATLAQARAADVSGFVVPAACAADWPRVLALKNIAGVRALALGIHPWHAGEMFSGSLKAATDRLAQLEDMLRQNPQLWVGEIGLDYLPRLDMPDKAVQQAALRAQLELAQRYRRPVILHNLRAMADILRLLRETAFDCGGIAHAFSGSLEEARALIGAGLLIGIGSLLLNPNARKAQRAAAELPAESIVLETDGPFMLGNTVNTPANLRRIAETAAALRGTDLHTLASQCEQNLQKLLPRPHLPFQAV